MEWEEDEQGEELISEDEKEEDPEVSADEDEEEEVCFHRLGYEAVPNFIQTEWMVPHGYLSDDEGVELEKNAVVKNESNFIFDYMQLVLIF